jgi:predicted transcriptional regulator of viral defense system
MRELLKLAERQYSLVTRGQALTSGMSVGELRSLMKNGLLIPVYRGVYRLAGSPYGWRQRTFALILAAGDDAVASRQTAAELSGVAGFAQHRVEVVRPWKRNRSPGRLPGLHESTFLPAHHVTEIDGIPVTTVERTLFDLAGVLKRKRLERAVANAVNSRLTSIAKLEKVFAETARRGRKGSAAMRKLLTDIGQGYVPTESELEDLVIAVLDAAGLPLPKKQRNVGNTTTPIGRVDFLYTAARLVIEADSKRHHASWLDQEADKLRDLRLTAAGYQIIRVTWHQLTQCPEEFIAAVRAVVQGIAA